MIESRIFRWKSKAKDVYACYNGLFETNIVISAFEQSFTEYHRVRAYLRVARCFSVEFDTELFHRVKSKRINAKSKESFGLYVYDAWLRSVLVWLAWKEWKRIKKTYKISDVEQGRSVDRILRARNKIIQKLFDIVNHKLNGTRLILKRRTTSENLSFKNPRVLLKSTNLFYESIDVYQLKRDGCIRKIVASIFTNYRYKRQITNYVITVSIINE